MVVKAKKKVKKNVTKGICYVQASFRNTIVTFTDVAGNVITWASAGQLGFRGSKKSTPFAAQTAGSEAARKAMEQGMSTVDVRVTGPGAGRENVIRALFAAGLKVTSLSDFSPIPHNGCKAPKKRRG